VGVFSYEEIDLDPVRVEAGIRYDWTNSEPAAEDLDSDIGHVRERSFGSLSGSFGLLYNAREGVTLGASVSRAFRTPDVNELFSEGPHLAAYAFEVGNPSLEEEVGTGIDVFVRFHAENFHAEFTGFTNLIDGYVFGRDTGELSRTRLPIYQYFGEDARFAGFEGAMDWVLSGPVKLEGVVSYVRGEIRATSEPLPLVPPLQVGATLAYEPAEWFVRAESKLVAKQARVGEFETMTDGYTRFDLRMGLNRTLGGRLNILTIGLENVTNEEYRNHLSRVKEIMPEAGRGITVTYRVVF
jgi:iron complex outermembrane receptor protein